MVLIWIILFMWWCDITLNALLLLIMLYVDVVELYNMCLMHDVQYWRCILTMKVSHCAWYCCCMYSMLHAFMLLNRLSVFGESQILLYGFSSSRFWRWWNQWVIIGGDANELVALILGGEDRSGEPGCSRIGTTCIESSCWVSLQYIDCICYYVGWLIMLLLCCMVVMLLLCVHSRCVDYVELCCGMGDVHVIIWCLLIIMFSFI
jgi:hypothetical protein